MTFQGRYCIIETEVRPLNGGKSPAVMPSSLLKEVIAMDKDYIITFMIILMLLALAIKK